MKVCPNNALHPTFMEAGLEALWTPVLVPRIGYCEPNCVLCGQVCPTGAIWEITEAQKLGKAAVPGRRPPQRPGPTSSGADGRQPDQDRHGVLRPGPLPPLGDGHRLHRLRGVVPDVAEGHLPRRRRRAWTREGNAKTVRRPARRRRSAASAAARASIACPVKDRPAVYVTSVGETRSKTNQFILPAAPRRVGRGSGLGLRPTEPERWDDRDAESATARWTLGAGVQPARVRQGDRRRVRGRRRRPRPRRPGFGQTQPAAPVETNIADFMKVPKTPALAARARSPARSSRSPTRSLAGRDDRQVRRQGHRARWSRRGITTLTGKRSEGELHAPHRSRGRRRHQGQPRRPAAHQHPARGRRRRHRVARRQRHPEVEHRHLGPLRLHAEGRRLHEGALPRHRHRRAPDDGRERGTSGGGRDGKHVSIDNFDKDVFYFVKGVVGKGVTGATRTTSST